MNILTCNLTTMDLYFLVANLKRMIIPKRKCCLLLVHMPVRRHYHQECSVCAKIWLTAHFL